MKKWDQRANRPRVLFDMDDVISDFVGYLLKCYNEANHCNIERSAITSWDLSHFNPPMRDIYIQKGFFLQIPEKNHSLDVIDELIQSGKYDVYIITACNSVNEFHEKIEWLSEKMPHFNMNRIISCKEKEMIRGDVLIDDKIANLDACSPYMHCILMDMPHNRECEIYPRIHNLHEVVALLDELFYR